MNNKEQIIFRSEFFKIYRVEEEEEEK